MVRVQVIAYTPTDFLEEPDTTIGRCRELVEKNAVTWVNVVDPDERTLDELETLFGFHPLALEDAQNEDLHPKVEVYDDTVFIVVRPSGTGIAHLHDVRTDVVRLRNDLRPQRDIFGVLSRLEVPLFRKEMRNYLRDVQDHMISVLDTLDAYREITGSLMEVQATLVSNQSNEVIKVLTVIFTITLPIAIVSSAFGMNVAFFGFNAAEGLYLALLLMGAPTGILAWWMHRKGWL